MGKYVTTSRFTESEGLHFWHRREKKINVEHKYNLNMDKNSKHSLRRN